MMLCRLFDGGRSTSLSGQAERLIPFSDSDSRQQINKMQGQLETDELVVHFDLYVV
jgi:hypothetical protein